MTTYTYSLDLVVDEQTLTKITSTPGHFYDAPGGTVQAITDLNGTPLPYLITNVSGFYSSFKTSQPVGWILFGTYWHAVTSVEAQSGPLMVEDAAVSVSAAQASAVAAAADAVISQSQPGMVSVIQNIDDSWPDRRTVTTDRLKVIAWLYRNASEATWPPRKEINVTGDDLANPTPADLFLPYA